MGNELLKHRLKRELKSRGVRINRLLLDVSDDRIVVSGEVSTFRSRPQRESARIIALSGTHPNDVGLSLEDGEVDALLPKPVNVDKLLQAIRKYSSPNT